jgi:predicted DNA-binding transcriptional regulator YafY
MKLDRLIAILVLLLRRDRIPARELAELFEVSVRTVLRDVDAIDRAGIPIVTYQGAGGGIGIAEGFRLDRSLLTPDDMAALVASLKGVASSVPDTRHTVLLEKLRNTLSPEQLQTVQAKTNQLIIDLEPWGGAGPVKERLAVLRQAIADRRQVRLAYTDAAGQSSERLVEPYSLVLKGQRWYLYAWCEARQGFRLFRLGRITGLSVTETRFVPREVALDELPWEHEWWKPENAIQLELVFERELSAAVREWFGEDAIREDDQRLMVKAVMPENPWLYGFLLSFGPGLEVVNPPHIRRVLRDLAAGIVRRYSSET